MRGPKFETVEVLERSRAVNKVIEGVGKEDKIDHKPACLFALGIGRNVDSRRERNLSPGLWRE